MLTGFNDLTFDLTDKELEVLPFVVSSLKKKTKQQPVTNAQIVEGLQRNLKYKSTQPRVRKMISYIRVRGIITNLVGDVSGYYCTNDPKELQKWIDQMKQRAGAILAAVNTAKIPNNETTLF